VQHSDIAFSRKSDIIVIVKRGKKKPSKNFFKKIKKTLDKIKCLCYNKYIRKREVIK